MRKYFFILVIVLLVWVGHPSKKEPVVFNKVENSILYINSDVLILTNQYRQSLGLSYLKETDLLDKAAEKKCNDMETRNYWAHQVNGELFYQFDPPALFYGENLARGYNSDQEVIEAWKASPTHNKNLIEPKFTQVGFAHCQGVIKNLVVQELVLPL